jgi:hypothetical protein
MGDLTRILSDTGRNGEIPLIWNADREPLWTRWYVMCRWHTGQVLPPSQQS